MSRLGGLLIHEWDEKQLRNLNEILDQIRNVIDGNLEIEDNLRQDIITFTTTDVAGTNIELSHTLKKTPTGYMIVSRSGDSTLKDGSITWTTTKLSVKSTGGSGETFKIMVF